MKSFKLLFKNGFKQLFQFKFSLAAILILSMIGALVISTSVTTVKKLDGEFNKVVNSQEKFTNVYENQSLKSQNSDFSYLPILDLISKEDSTSAFTNFNGEVQSHFNLDLTKDNFIGKYFKSDIFQIIFPFLLTHGANDKKGIYLTPTPHINIKNYVTDAPKSKNFLNYYADYTTNWVKVFNNKYEGSTSNTLKYDDDSTWYSYATDLLFLSYIEELSGLSGDKLKNTLIGEYTLNNPNWYKSFLGKTWNQNLNNNKLENQDFNIYKYVHFSLSTLISQVMYMGDEFLSIFRNQMITEDGGSWSFFQLIYTPIYAYAYIFGNQINQTSTFLSEDQFNSIHKETCKFWRIKDKDSTHKIDNEDNPYDIKKDWSKYIGGNKYNSFNFNKELIQFKIGDTHDDIVNNIDNTLPSNFSSGDFKRQLLENGYRGQINPIITINGNTKDPDVYIPTIIAKNDFKSLQGITDGLYKNTLQKDVNQAQLLSAFYQSDEHSVNSDQMYGIDYEQIKKDMIEKNISQEGIEFEPIKTWEYSVYTTVYNNPTNHYYKLHLKLAAEFSKMKITIRDELVYSDILAGKKYRLITMDSLENTNFEMIEGVPPTKRGQAAVSSQYAKYNKVRVGDLLKIGKSNLQVTGIAVDSYSFYPVVDPMMPVPKPKTSGIMYMQKETLNEIFKNDTTQMDMSSYKQSVYLFSKSNEQKNEYLFKSNLSASNYYQNYKNYENNVDQISSVKLKSFDESVESLNWRVYQIFIKTFVTSIVLIVIVIMVAISIMLFLVIKKSIEMNIEKIAILISIGYKPFEISVNYIWYAIIILLISIPLGWIFGTLLQIPIQRLLQDFFTIDARAILFSWEAFLISALVIGILLGLVLTMLIAWRKMSKPYIELINENNIPNVNHLFNFIKNKIFKKNGFKRRMALDVASSSSKSLILMSVLIAVSATMISNLIFIPSVAVTTKSKYAENVKYKNEFKFNDPIANDPLSARNINFWDGVKSNVDSMVKINYEIGKTKDNVIMNKPNGYKSISSNSSFLPQLLYSPKTDEMPEPYLRSSYEDMVEDPSEFLSIILGSFMYNLHNSNGKSLSIGMFDQFITENLNEYHEDNLSLSAKSKLADRLVRIIAGGLPAVLQMVNFPNMDFTSGLDWKEALLRSFTTKAPSYIKEYIGVKERQSAINFGFNTINVVPRKDSLGTALKLNSNEGVLDVVGVDKNQTAFQIPKKSFKKLYGSEKDINNIYKYLNGEIDTLESNEYFDKNTNTLNIPIIVNQSEKIVNKIDVGNKISSINTNSNKYVLNSSITNKFILPNNAWKYDDSDFVDSDYFNDYFGEDKEIINSNYTTSKEGHSYKNAYSIDPNKVSYKNLYTHVVSGDQDEFYKTLDQTSDTFKNKENQGAIKLKDGSYMFGDFAYNYNNEGDSEIQASYVRPYYNFRNFKLFIPTSLIADKNEANYKEELFKFVLDNGRFSGNWDRLKNAGWITDEKDIKSIKVTPQDNIPTDTINAYKAAGVDALDDWVVIKPYEIDSLANKRGHEQYLTQVSSAYTTQYWLKNVLSRTNNDLLGLKLESTPNNTMHPEVKVNFNVIDIMDTYNGVGMITNSDLLNLLISTENIKYAPFDNSRLDKNKPHGTQEGVNLYDKKVFVPLNKNTWEKDAYISGTKEEANKLIVNKYSNSIYSNIVEPLQITTGVSMQTKDSSASFAIHDDFNSYGIAIDETKLLAEQKEIIDQLFKLAMFIALIFITIIFIIVIIIILISSDIYLSKLRMFIVSLKAFGYRKREIRVLLFSVAFVMVFIATTIGFLISWGTVSGVIATIIKFGMAVPFVVSPWVPLITFSLMIPVWIIGSWIISDKILLLRPVDGFKQS